MTYSVDSQVSRILVDFYESGQNYDVVIIFDSRARLELWRYNRNKFHGNFRHGTSDSDYIDITFEVESLKIQYVGEVQYLVINQANYCNSGDEGLQLKITETHGGA